MTASGGIANTAGGMSIIGTSRITGNTTISGTLTVSAATTMQGLTCSSITSSASTMYLTNSGSLKNMGFTSSGDFTSTGKNVVWGYLNSGSIGQYNATITFMSNSNGVTLTTGATAWAAASDERLKDVTGTYDNALLDISKIKPIKFTWKQHAENGPQVGVIAQSVVGVVDEAISTIAYPTDQNEYLSVKYTELIPISIAAIQELGIKLQAAMDRITALETQLASK